MREALAVPISWNGGRGSVSTLDDSPWAIAGRQACRAVRLRGISVKAVAAVIVTVIVEGSG
jgi:hypothetical protein